MSDWERLVQNLEDSGAARSPAVRAALRRVPRAHFAPWLSPEEVHTDDAFVIPGHAVGAVATISQPTAVALMLEAFDLRPGLRVLEIGAGTGYNAALMAELVGPAGLVVTLDLEADLVERAQKNLAGTGYTSVRVLHRDGAQGAPELAPYDRIVATVGLWDLPPVWLSQLAPEGRIVAPVHLGGPPEAHVLLRLARVEDHLEGVGLFGLDMVLMRGENAQGGLEAPSRAGPGWQGAAADRLAVEVHFGPTTLHPADHEVVLYKRSCQIRFSELRQAPA